MYCKNFCNLKLSQVQKWAADFGVYAERSSSFVFIWAFISNT